MPLCENCSTPLLLDSNLNEFCADCSGEIVLSKIESLQFCKTALEKWEKVKYDLIRAYDRWELIKRARLYRELVTRDIVMNAKIELDKLIAVDYLLRDLLRSDEFKGDNITNESFDTLIGFYSKFYVRTIDNIEYIEQDYGLVVVKVDIDQNEIFEETIYPKKQFLDNFLKSRFYFKSEWGSVYDLFKSNLVFSKEDGERYFKEHAEEYERIEKKLKGERPVSYRSLSIQDYIVKYLLLIIQLGSLLRRNDPTISLYSFNNLEKVVDDPRVLMDVSNIGMKYGKPTDLVAKISKEKFSKKLCKYHSKAKAEEILTALMFDPEEGSTPLVVDRGKYLFISPMVMTIITLYLFYVMYPDEVNATKNEKAEEFEKYIVPPLLKKNGFNLDDPKHKDEELIGRNYSAYGGKNFDIIGTKDDSIYVFECKKWGLTPKYFYKYRRENRVDELEEIYRDLGIKADFIRKNPGEIGYDKTKFKDVKKVLVLENFGHVSNTKYYKDMLIADLSTLDSV